MLANYLTLAILVLQHAAVRRDRNGPQDGFRVIGVNYTGNGCPAKQLICGINKRYNNFHFWIEKYSVNEPGDQEMRECDLQMKLKVPEGWSFSVSYVKQRGGIRIDGNTTAFSNHHFSYDYSTGNNENVLNANFRISGPEKPRFEIKKTFTHNWSKCGGKNNVEIHSDLRLDGMPGYFGAWNKIRSYYLVQYGLKWKKCSPSDDQVIDETESTANETEVESPATETEVEFPATETEEPPTATETEVESTATETEEPPTATETEVESTGAETPDSADTRGEGYIGCFADSDQDRDLKITFPDGQYLIWSDCKRFCFDQKKEYAGIRGGGICSCGDTYGKFGPKDDSYCDLRCGTIENGGDGTLNCGGINANAIFSSGYEPTVVSDSISERPDNYIGCYPDDPEGGDRDLKFEWDTTSTGALNPSECNLNCRNYGFSYSGSQNEKCFCGNSYGNLGDKLDEEMCNTECPSEGNNCGGENANAIFKVL